MYTDYNNPTKVSYNWICMVQNIITLIVDLLSVVLAVSLMMLCLIPMVVNRSIIHSGSRTVPPGKPPQPSFCKKRNNNAYNFPNE